MRRQNSGITLVELLIGMAILGIILAVASNLLISTGRVSSQQDRQVDAAANARLALFRIGEIVRQAAYVYPPGVTITSGGESYTTGPGALAVLVPAGTTYCAASTQVYCGFVYAISDRDEFVPPLPARGPTQDALVELRVEQLVWAKDAVPATAILSWPDGDLGLLSDGAVAAGTDLGTNVRVSPLETIYDSAASFSSDPGTISTNSLINGVEVSISLTRQSAGGNAGVTQQLEVFTRAVPRSAPPNLTRDN